MDSISSLEIREFLWPKRAFFQLSRISVARDSSQFGRTEEFHLWTGWSGPSLLMNGKCPQIRTGVKWRVCDIGKRYVYQVSFGWHKRLLRLTYITYVKAIRRKMAAYRETLIRQAGRLASPVKWLTFPPSSDSVCTGISLPLLILLLISNETPAYSTSEANTYKKHRIRNHSIDLT